MGEGQNSREDGRLDSDSARRLFAEMAVLGEHTVGARNLTDGILAIEVEVEA